MPTIMGNPILVVIVAVILNALVVEATSPSGTGPVIGIGKIVFALTQSHQWSMLTRKKKTAQIWVQLIAQSQLNVMAMVR